MKLRSNDFDNLFSTTLAQTINASDLTIYLNSVPTNATEGFLVLDAGDASKREVVYYNAVGANYVSCPASGGRGQAGTSAQSHDSGSSVKMNFLREHLKPIRDAVFTGWIELNHVPVYASASTITIPVDVTAIFTPGRKLKLTFATSGAKYFSILSSSYGAGNTTITLSADKVLNEVINSVEIDVNPASFSIPIPFLSQGQMQNGQILPSVTSNNLTVAIKTLAGTDPSPSNPVFVRIGNAIQKITAPLSKSLNAGTNWMNAGSAELATNEIDYFVYLGYNATDGVTLGFSRIPFAAQYSDFSLTTTDEKYAAISTITNAVGTDYYENIGRFAATLSAGAGYTWSVPTFTANNLIQRPIYKTGRLTALSAVTSQAGSITTVSVRNIEYVVDYNLIQLNFNITVASNGTGSGNVNATLPFTILANRIFSGRENAVVGNILQGVTNGTYVSIFNATGGYPIGGSGQLLLTGVANLV